MVAKQLIFAVLILVSFILVTRGQRRGTVRLARDETTSPSFSSGRVEIYLTSWGYICDDTHFATTEAHVVCHQLGYTGASSYTKSGLDSFGVKSGYSFLLDDVDCLYSDYLTILQCSHRTYIDSTCSSGSDEVSVTCLTTRIWNYPYDGQIRLQQGIYSSQGLVEVYCSGQWGTVCGNGFGQTEADTVCKQLGYTRAAGYDNLSYRGNSSQPIWLDDVSCLFSRNCLKFCQSCPSTENHDCGHSADITVECEFGLDGSSSVLRTTCAASIAVTSVTYAPQSASITIVIVSIVGGIFCCVVPIAIPICICICIFVVITLSERNRRKRTQTVAMDTPSSASTVVAASMNSYQPVNNPVVSTHTQPPAYSTQPPPSYTEKSSTPVVPAQTLAAQTPATEIQSSTD